jgi:hypothetical protein
MIIMGKGKSLGRCDRCHQTVYGGDGTPDNPGKVAGGQEGLRYRIHTHKDPYTVIRFAGPAPVANRDQIDDGDDYRYWHDHAPWFAR